MHPANCKHEEHTPWAPIKGTPDYPREGRTCMGCGMETHRYMRPCQDVSGKCMEWKNAPDGTYLICQSCGGYVPLPQPYYK